MATDSSFDRLTARERDCLVLVAELLDTQEIATRLNLSPNTVDSYCNSASKKLGSPHRRVAARRYMEWVGRPLNYSGSDKIGLVRAPRPAASSPSRGGEQATPAVNGRLKDSVTFDAIGSMTSTNALGPRLGRMRLRQRLLAIGGLTVVLAVVLATSILAVAAVVSIYDRMQQ